ncbi:helix-turn-helix domain-containing protein [Streptomyces sp. NPDC057638]|uniref:helix-turn-helix domain-containing protein n=1 Tax=Streptomyces sp. NPDC057638 TaxID=3346190 RepID=UPI0036A54D9F
MSDLDQLAQALGRNLKHWRGERGLTLDALAARSGVSRGMIIQIEQARTNPSVGTTVKLADALGVSIATLLDEVESAAVRVVTPEQSVRMWSTSTGSRARLLAGTERPGPLELWTWRLMPGDGSESDAHADGTVELIHVTAGELTLVVDGEEHRVAMGSSAVFDANVPHGYRNDGDAVVELTMAVSLATGG